jgi:hypothetical protein
VLYTAYEHSHQHSTFNTMIIVVYCTTVYTFTPEGRREAGHAQILLRGYERGVAVVLYYNRGLKRGTV